MDVIDNEIFEFNFNFFDNIGVVLQENQDFIIKNSLITPKENFIILYDYLNNHITHFKSIDQKVFNVTILKLQKDIQNLYKIYLELKHIDIVQEAKKHIMYRSKLMQSMKNDIKSYQKESDSLPFEIEYIQKNLDNYKKLQLIYINRFKELFFLEREDYISMLLSMINTKIFYLDKMMWRCINSSDVILQKYKDVVHKNGLNSKIYIKYRLNIIMPYSHEYEYLQRCLRVFK